MPGRWQRVRLNGANDGNNNHTQANTTQNQTLHCNIFNSSQNSVSACVSTFSLSPPSCVFPFWLQAAPPLTTSYLWLFSVLPVLHPSFKALLFTHAHRIIPILCVSHVSHVSCIPCLVSFVRSILARSSPTPHLLSITHCFFVTRAGNGVISSNFFSSILLLLFLLHIKI